VNEIILRKFLRAGSSAQILIFAFLFYLDGNPLDLLLVALGTLLRSEVE
jgi:hypothetical protein